MHVPVLVRQRSSSGTGVRYRTVSLSAVAFGEVAAELDKVLPLLLPNKNHDPQYIWLPEWLQSRIDTSAYLDESSCMSRLTALAKEAHSSTTHHDPIRTSTAN